MKPWQNKIINKVNNLPIHHYNKFCIILLSALGFTNLKTKVSTKSFSILGSGTISLGILAQDFVFLANQNSELNTTEMALELRILGNGKADKGLIISTGKFSRELKRAAKKKGEMPIDLIGGAELLERLIQLNSEFIIKQGETYTINELAFQNLINK